MNIACVVQNVSFHGVILCSDGISCNVLYQTVVRKSYPLASMSTQNNCVAHTVRLQNICKVMILDCMPSNHVLRRVHACVWLRLKFCGWRLGTWTSWSARCQQSRHQEGSFSILYLQTFRQLTVQELVGYSSLYH